MTSSQDIETRETPARQTFKITVPYALCGKRSGVRHGTGDLSARATTCGRPWRSTAIAITESTDKADAERKVITCRPCYRLIRPAYARPRYFGVVAPSEGAS